ncbi:MAG: F0F1 ATP synthase subunit delta [Candidatus Omnitrophota bacterium]|nr:F0F1 ATP synthase subunit delta [Candidatus Omnitrophota bacterium]
MLIVSLVLLQVIIFAGLIFALKRILTKNVVTATRHLEEMNVDFVKKDEEIKKRLEEVNKKSQDILTKAEEDARRASAQTIKEAESQKEEIIKQARKQNEDIIQQAERSRQLLISEINDRIARESTGKACELIQSILPEKFALDVHMHWVDELIDAGFGQLERLNIPKEVTDARIVTAFPLTEEQRKKLHKLLKNILDKDIKLNEEVDKRIVAGVSIIIGSLVLDGTLQNKMMEKVKGA